MKYTGKIRTMVREAAIKLDEAYPEWWEEIDLDLLDMYNSDYCILGQLYGSYYSLRANPLRNIEGFGGGLGADSRRTHKFNKAWKKEIKYRR